MRTLRDLAIVTALMAAGTWLIGWWSILIVACLLAVWHRRGRTALLQGVIGAILSSLLLLGIQALFGSSLRDFDRALAISLGVPPGAPLILTVVLPVLLVLTTVGTVSMAKRLRRPSRPAAPV